MDEAARCLLGHVVARRASVTAFIRETRPRLNRLANISIVASAVAAVFTAGPALGGEGFTAGVQSALALRSDSVVWRVLCLVALAVSVTAAITANMVKRNDTAARIGVAEACAAELENLQTALELGQIPVAEATKLYAQCVQKIAFVPESEATVASYADLVQHDDGTSSPQPPPPPGPAAPHPSGGRADTGASRSSPPFRRPRGGPPGPADPPRTQVIRRP
jgi:hypothetical protein